MKQFIQLSTAECQYLLDLIHDLDGETIYTQDQRLQTSSRIRRILDDPSSTKLVYKDVEYLLDLLDDDDLAESQSIRDSTTLTILEIQKLQKARFSEREQIEQEREQRRFRRLSRLENHLKKESV